MTSPNGRLTASELGTVENLPLSKPTINAYLRMKAAAKAAGIDIWIAQPIGAYRSYFVQGDMKVHPALYGLSTVSTVSIASPGYSTHGLGNAIDIGSFGSGYGTAGAKRSDWLIQHASEFGFYREFGTKDPNHFHHDGFTAVDPIIDVAGSGGVTPIKEGIFMALTDAEQKELLDGIRQILPKTNDLHGAIGAGQGAGLPADASVLANARNANSNAAAALAAIKALPAPTAAAADVSHALWWDQTIERATPDGKGTVKIPAIQELADIKTNVLNIVAAGGVDATALAAKLAPLITVPAGAPQLTEAQIENALRTVLAGLVLVPRAE